MYLRSIARKHVQGEVSAADIEKDVKRKFGIDLTGKLAELQEPMEKSRVCTQPRLPSFHPSTTKAHACCTFAVYSNLTSFGKVRIQRQYTLLVHTVVHSQLTTGDLQQGCGCAGGDERLRGGAGSWLSPMTDPRGSR